MPEILLQVKNLCKSFSGIKALKNVSLEIKCGEIHCLAGENGCGKSTLIKCISGVYEPDEGEIYINGKVYKKLTPKEAIDEGIQIIYQDFSVFPNLTVAENIALTYELAQNNRFVNWKNVNKIAQNVLDKIEVKMNLSERVENLSVADKQLVAISRALVHNAKLIVMDEPTTALTKKEVKSLFRIIKGLQREGISILFVSHKLEEIFELAEKITIVRNGHNAINGDINEFDRKKLIYHMTGKEIEENYFDTKNKNNKCLLKVENLSRRCEFKDISFELYSGEILGITGLLGSGRTELALSLFGLRPADSGQIYINDKPVKINSVKNAIDNKIAYVPEDRLTEGLFLDQSIGRNVIINNIKNLLNKNKLIDFEKVDSEVNKWVNSLNIVTSSPSMPVRTLSGGNQQRVVIAKWLSQNPQILILNGPTVGIDIGSKNEIHNIIRELADKGVGVIIISDDIPEILQNCNRILTMRKGRIVGEKLSKSITEAELVCQLSESYTGQS